MSRPSHLAPRLCALLAVAILLPTAQAASDPSAKLGLQVGTLVAAQCPAPDLPHIVAVRSLGDIAEWFNPQAFEAAIADELPNGSEVGRAPVVYFDNTNERQIRGRLAGDYGSLFLVELVPAEQRVDASVSGHCLAGVIEEVEMRVVSASPPEPDLDFVIEPPVIATSAAPSPTSASPPQPARSEPPKPRRTDPPTPVNPRLTASSKTLPRLKMRNVDTIRARVPSCSTALHEYETSRHGIAISAVLGTLGVAIMTAGISTGTDPAVGAGIGLTAFGTMMPSFFISAGPKAEAKECIVDAGYQLGR